MPSLSKKEEKQEVQKLGSTKCIKPRYSKYNSLTLRLCKNVITATVSRQVTISHLMTEAGSSLYNVLAQWFDLPHGSIHG